MSKICDRNYQGNSMYTQKMIDGIACCPSCGKPAICHGKPIEMRALFWAMSGDNGNSSWALANHMLGFPQRHLGLPPSDADDRGRCTRLLELIPEWLPRLGEMFEYDKSEQPTGITIGGSGITAYQNSWKTQVPLIVKEGNLNATN